MLPPIPFPDDYGVSQYYGFLPDELPLEILPDPYYKRWEYVVSNLQALLLSKRLRHTIDNLPIVTASRLRTPAEWRRAYVLLSFMTHAYIWGGDRPEEVCTKSSWQYHRLSNTNLENSTNYFHTLHPSMQPLGSSHSRNICWRMSLELQTYFS